jgi:hypothetical protein
LNDASDVGELRSIRAFVRNLMRDDQVVFRIDCDLHIFRFAPNIFRFAPNIEYCSTAIDTSHSLGRRGNNRNRRGRQLRRPISFILGGA